MLPTRLAEIQRCIGFSAADAEALSELLARCGDALQQVTEALDRQIEQELDATRLANDSPAERARLKRLLGGWLRSLLQGPYDEDYWRKRRRIGQRHVEVKLPQYYMCMAMQVVQRELEAIARRLYQTEPDRQERLRAAIRKICYLDLSIMLDSYQSHYQARIRQAERRVRQRLEAQLAAQQSFAKTLLDNAAVGVMAFDSSGRLTSYNRKMQEIFGYTADEIARRREWLSRAFPDPQDCQEAELYFTALASGNVPEGQTLLTVRRKDGKQRRIEFWSSPIVSDGQTQGAVAIAFDVTDRQQLEQQLIRAERLAAIGQLAASLAHEIKNPLAGISGAIQVIRSHLPADDLHRDVLEEVLHQIGRLDSTMRDLLVYARPNPLELRRCNVQTVVDRVLTVVAAEPGFAGMQVIKDYSPDLPEVELDPDQMEQVCMNIILNAAQAMPQGGRVTIRARHENGQVILSFADEGPGMSPHNVSRAFEPFFTTKVRGTGLGLPICKRIVEAHGGTIGLASEPNVGTCVTIRLPIRHAQADRGLKHLQ